MFKVGQKVVCVNDDPYAFVKTRIPHDLLLDGLTKGTIYTVRFCGRSDHPLVGGYLGVSVREITRCYPDVPYDARRFQPLRETSIDVFTQLLVKLPELVE